VAVNAPTLAAPETLHAPGVADMTELARAACDRYGVSPDCTMHRYPLTENWTYRVQAASGAPVVLRICRPGGRSLEQVMSELAWMGAIGGDWRSLVPAVIPTAGESGAQVTRDMPDDPCYCVMFSCAPGTRAAEDELAAWFHARQTHCATAPARRVVGPSRRGSASRAGTSAPRWAIGRTGIVADRRDRRRTDPPARAAGRGGAARLRGFVKEPSDSA
jgi:hypothetical protein